MLNSYDIVSMAIDAYEIDNGWKVKKGYGKELKYIEDACEVINSHIKDSIDYYPSTVYATINDDDKSVEVCVNTIGISFSITEFCKMFKHAKMVKFYSDDETRDVNSVMVYIKFEGIWERIED